MRSSGNPLGYTNIDLYTGWKNVVIDGCTLTLLHDGEAGGCIWIRDFFEHGGTGLTFTNNTCHKICHDEILAVFKGILSDITIKGNHFLMEEGEASPSAHCFSFGILSDHVTKNIVFSNNTLDVRSNCRLFSCANVDGMQIANNDITYSHTPAVECRVFFDSQDKPSKNIDIVGNTIRVKDLAGMGLGYFVDGPFGLRNNTITIDSDVNTAVVYESEEEISGNTIVINGKVNAIGRSIYDFHHNTVTVNGQLTNCFWYTSMTMKKNLSIAHNIIHYPYVEPASEFGSFLRMVSVTMDNKEVTASDNKIVTTNTNEKARYLYLDIKDAGAQKLTFSRNELANYKTLWVRAAVDPLLTVE